MKTLLLVVAMMMVAATVADAQPEARLYFDYSLTRPFKDCPDQPSGTVVEEAYIVVQNFDTWINAMEFKLDYPTELLWLSDSEIDATLSLGNTRDGIAMTWSTPQWFDGPHVVAKVQLLWMCQGCGGGQDKLITVGPNPQSGKIRAVEWPSQVEVPMNGVTSYVCPSPVSTEDSTWGKVKALYSD